MHVRLEPETLLEAVYYWLCLLIVPIIALAFEGYLTPASTDIPLEQRNWKLEILRMCYHLPFEFRDVDDILTVSGLKDNQRLCCIVRAPLVPAFRSPPIIPFEM